ncbi:C-3',4' desaturase CrtD [Lyngbya confervoides]|uniref:C-3',4' desaturase CrtD n=1 Tax=Lyngbya confervoides BDU141951 TaxID=1574623 RepID=A0ABD4T775_9CYAN|nr:C-3',4' desaturase CrtD [Lyngbya confervoides]MCM1984389.1 C-3',4' desaturase CrtD [Lyngbya confervoides BDU141951]
MSDVPSSHRTKAIVIGAGIGGLTAAALLARRGYQVQVYDQAYLPGGCASTFRRRGFTFDVGATQVAGLEPGGIHHQIFQALDLPLPQASFCDPACAVYLPGESTPISVWRDPQRWHQERTRQFPGSESFWTVLAQIFQANWKFQCRDPVIPPRTLWDWRQLIGAVRLDTLPTLPYLFSTVGDLLKAHGLEGDRRLKTFLDLQLKLYSQVGADQTALLYAATALGISQAPFGLYHLKGSMQELANSLVTALKRDRGELRMRHRVEKIMGARGSAQAIQVRNLRTGTVWCESADCIVANVTVQDFVNLTEDPAPPLYQARVDRLPAPSGAFVIYLGVKDTALPTHCPPHLQFLYDYDGPIGENNSLFVSVSRPGDGRAPQGHATIIASSFTDPQRWFEAANPIQDHPAQDPLVQDPLVQDHYAQMKQAYTQSALQRLGQFFNLGSETIVHQEAATPLTFAKFTGRHRGIVGGIGQRRFTFGPFGVSTRTPFQNLWLVGDSTHPGEGTAGVSYSAWTAIRQIEQAYGAA